jgi:mRNA-degrading endonuclease toxin of MazEF toxin-antitoxin module
VILVDLRNDRLNKNLSTLTVVPMTTHSGTGKVGAHEVEVKAGDGGLEEDSAAQPCQVRTIDRFERVTQIWGELSEPVMDRIDDLLAFVLSDA